MVYELAIFDMDGTILNTLEDLADSLNYSLIKSGFPRRTLDEVRSFVGNGIRKLVEHGVPDGTAKPDIDRVFQSFTEHYRVHCTDKARPYDGIPELLSKLRSSGLKTAVVSNKADYAVRELCSRYFDGLFDFAVGERSGVRRKPAPDSVNELLQQVNCDKETAVYIGDSEVDIQTAINAQIECIIVDWGFRDREYLIKNGALKIVSTPGELYSKIIPRH